jgi:hypothetical protein
MTTNEETKRNKLSKAMVLVKKTLLEALKRKGIEYNGEKLKITNEDIQKYKSLLFESKIVK